MCWRRILGDLDKFFKSFSSLNHNLIKTLSQRVYKIYLPFSLLPSLQSPPLPTPSKLPNRALMFNKHKEINLQMFMHQQKVVKYISTPSDTSSPRTQTKFHWSIQMRNPSRKHFCFIQRSYWIYPSYTTLTQNNTRAIWTMLVEIRIQTSYSQGQQLLLKLEFMINVIIIIISNCNCRQSK